MADEVPTRSEWRKLHEAAVEFRDLAPWEWMWDSQLFGVEDPESGETGYCCIMGGLGELYAFSVYEGLEGLQGYWDLQLAQIDQKPDAGDLFATQKCLMVDFGDRRSMKKTDLEIIKSTGMKFRGRNAWPTFRSYLPGYEPWYLTAAEARRMTVALGQAVDVASRCWKDPTLLPPLQPGGEILVRVRRKHGRGGTWADEVRFLPPPSPPEIPEAAVDEERLALLKQACAPSRRVLELDYFLSNASIQEQPDERPWFPYMIMVVDAASALVLAMELTSKDELPAALSGQLLHVVETMGELPAQVVVGRTETDELLSPVCQRLGIRLSPRDHLPTLSMVRQEIAHLMGG